MPNNIINGAELLAAYRTGARDFTGADLIGADLTGAYLRRANLIGADLRGADLRRANLIGADLRGADLRGADLRRADLRRADLTGADLRRADLTGADLRRADLHGADLNGADFGSQWIIQGPIRSDGYAFSLTCLAGEGIRVKAGCRNFTVEEAYTHWRSTRGETALGEETFIILECLMGLAIARGYQDVPSEYLNAKRTAHDLGARVGPFQRQKARRSEDNGKAEM